MLNNTFRIVIIFFCALLFSSLSYGGDFIVVIDAGHGGHDAGCVGKKAKEKDITLDVAKRLSEKINKEMKGVSSILTRKDDRFITLQERANIANRNNGDLFISIHVNSVALESPHRSSVQGAQVYTLGPDKSKNNLNVAMRENSVMELEKDYSVTYKGFDPNSTESYIIFELNQNAHMKQSVDFASIAQNHLIKDAGRQDKGVRQDGFWVLWATGMPSVLVELDFICNPTQEAFLNSPEGRQKCAEALYNAIEDYRKKINNQSIALGQIENPENKTEETQDLDNNLLLTHPQNENASSVVSSAFKKS